MSTASVTLDAARERVPLALGGAILVAALLTPLGSTMIAVAIPSLAREFGRDASALTSWLVMSYLLVGIAGQGFGGRLGDRVGHERALLGGLGLVALGSVLAWAAASPLPVIVARVLMAAGSAVTVPAAMALLRNGTEATRRGRAFGMFAAAMGLAAAIGPWLGGELVARSGWRAIFVVNLPLVALAIPAVLPGALRPRPGARATTSSRWLDARLLQRPAFGGGAAVLALQNLAQYALLFRVPVEIERHTGAGPHASGRVLLTMLLGSVVCALAGGRAAERLGARTVVLLGSCIAAAGYLLLTAPSALVRPGQLVPGLLVLGAGLGLATAPAQAAAMSAALRAEAGAAAGMLSTLRYAGGMIGIALLGLQSSSSMWPPAGGVALVLSIGAALALPGR